MRIAHVVTYISEDGAFGGPVAVALAQVEELSRRGHEVELLAGWDGRAQLDTLVPGRLHRVRRVGPGFSGLVAPGLASWLVKNARRFDVIHVHLARDLITLQAAQVALSAGCRLVVQPHGMIKPDRRMRARALDAVATRRVLRGAAAVLALTEVERVGLQSVAGSLPGLRMISNGIALSDVPITFERADPPVVMFLARLHPRKQVMAFAEAALALVKRGSPARFEVFGPDEGDLAELQRFIHSHGIGDRLVYRGAVRQGRAREELRRAAVYVLPAVREVFPMTVLEALSVGTPTVLGRDCGIATELERRGAASVTDGSPSAVADAIERLLVPGPRRNEQVRCGTESVRDWFSMDAVGAVLEQAYR